MNSWRFFMFRYVFGVPSKHLSHDHFSSFILFIFFNANFAKYFFAFVFLCEILSHWHSVYFLFGFLYFSVQFDCLFTSNPGGDREKFVCVITYSNVPFYRILSSVLFMARAKLCTVRQSLCEQRLLHLLFIENIMTVKYGLVIDVHSVCRLDDAKY